MLISLILTGSRVRRLETLGNDLNVPQVGRVSVEGWVRTRVVPMVSSR